MYPLSLCDVLADVFGSWPNFTQGAAGAFVGVVGAYLVAVSTTRKELSRDRARAREDAGIEAAGQLIRSLIALPRRIRILAHLDASEGVGNAYLERWETEWRNVEYQVTEHGTALPLHLETTALQVVGRLGGVLVADFDETGMPVWIEAAKRSELDETIRQIEQLVVDLQNYRRDPAAGRDRAPEG